MDDDMIATHFENLDRRIAHVEQILPTLATKDDLGVLATTEQLGLLATKKELHHAIAEAVAPLATKEELRHAIAAAVAPLATTEELRHAIAAAVAPLATTEELGVEIREEGERSRRHMDVVAEALRSDIQLLAQHLASGTKTRNE